MEKEAYQLWLDSLQEGDKVALKSSYGWGSSEHNYTVTKVTRITPTRRITVAAWGGTTFDNKGRPFGRSGGEAKLVPFDQTVTDAIDKKNLLYRLSHIRMKDLSLDQLEQIMAIVNNEVTHIGKVFVVQSISHGHLEGVDAVFSTEEAAKEFIENNKSMTVSHQFADAFVLRKRGKSDVND